MLVSNADSNAKWNMINQLLQLGVQREKIGVIEQYIKYHDYSIEVIDMNSLRIHKGGIIIKCDTSLELMIAEEVLGGEFYDYQDNKKKLVIDNGMNIGTASLFYADREDVEEVHSFEIDSYTYERALENIANSSPRLSDKIKTYNLGLGREECEEEYVIRIGKECKSAGMKKYFPGYCLGKDDKVVKMKIKKASSFLKDIVRNYKGTIILKMDCEGAEYGIIEDLIESDIMKEIDVILMEWHDGKKEYLQELLQKKEEYCCIFKTTRHNYGMCYAFRK